MERKTRSAKGQRRRKSLPFGVSDPERVNGSDLDNTVARSQPPVAQQSYTGPERRRFAAASVQSAYAAIDHDDVAGGPANGSAAPNSGAPSSGENARSSEPASSNLAHFIARNSLDRRSLITALICGALYFWLAFLSMSLSRFDSTLAAVWLPSATAVAVLLRARLANEIPFFVTTFLGSVGAHLTVGSPVGAALIFSAANMVTMALATAITRGARKKAPDMRRLSALSRFVWAGGLIGPLASAAIVGCAAAFGIGGGLADASADPITAAMPIATAWFLGDSMAMILLVPTLLLIVDAWSNRKLPRPVELAERSILMVASAAGVILVFSQNAFPLLFLIPPITLLHAFRLGSLGTAVHVMLVALVTTAMTWAGSGPIAEASALPATRLHLIQAFIAANFLTGLPIAAILARRDRLIRLLGDRRRELTLLADSITDAVLKLDDRGVCTYASPSVSDVLGREPADLVGTLITERAHEDASDRIAAVLETLLSGKADKERLTYRRMLDDAEGMPVFIEADCAITTDPRTGAREGIVISARDVTERVELELLLTRARRHAENAASAKSEFLANMSHEIRTPMNGVLGFAELMLQGDLDEEQRRHTEMIVQSGRSMMLLLNDILDLSKIEAGQISIDAAPVDLHATLDECVALHRPTARKKGLTLKLARDGAGADQPRSTDRHETVRLMTDGLRLRQIVLNLIGNAVKFTESGTIAITYGVADGTATIRVNDTGIGISATRLEKIFTPFTQGESDTARRYGGTGLGLSISRQLAELLGGVIGVESVPGEGSTFTLTLPAKLAASPSPAEEEEALAPFHTSTEPPLSPENLPDALPRDARILLAEDHDVNRVLVTEMLKRCGQTVAIAHDGNEAIAMVMDSMMRGTPYDLVLMDVQMPGCDGYAATRAIRGDGIGPALLPIVALTANAFPEDVAAAREAGMQAHLAKPLVFADLARALQRWLPTRIVEVPMDHDPLTPEAEARSAPSKASSVPSAPANNAEGAVHSPALLSRWLNRRSEAIEAVRDALATGLVTEAFEPAPASGENSDSEQPLPIGPREQLIGLVHKLAGTAAIFGEPELGEQAARFERALRQPELEEDCEKLAFELLAIADEPTGVISQPSHARR